MGKAVQQDPGLKRLEQYDAHPLPLDRIYYDAEFNCRGEFTLQSVADLAESIRRRGDGAELKGLDFPVVVQPIADMAGERPAGYDWRLIVGYRRYRAIQTLLKWSQIPATIRTGLSDHDARMLNFTENLERANLNMLEEARTIRQLYPEGVTLRHAADELKRPTGWVHVRLRLLAMPEALQMRAATGLLSQVNIATLARMETPQDQMVAAEEMIEAKTRGKSGKMPGLVEACKRRFRDRRSKAQISAMISRMFAAGIEGLAPRVAARCAGNIDDAALIKDIEAENQRPTFGSCLNRETCDANTTDPR